MNISQGFIAASLIFPDKVAIEFEGTQYTYAELEDLSGKAATVIGDLGVEKGDRVALVLGNVPSFAIWYFGILRAGGIAVSINTRLTEEEVAFMADDCGAKVLVQPTDVNHSCVERFLNVSDDGVSVNGDVLSEKGHIGKGFSEQLEPDEAGLILYTSGTTGFPKGATLSHSNVRSNVCAFNHLCNMRPHDRILLTVPLFHCFGQNALLNAGLNVGATLVLQRRFDLNETKALISEHQVTQLYGVPAMFQLLLEACEPADLSSVDYCFSAAATLAPQTGAEWQKKFEMPITEGYGLTETSPFASYNHRLKHVPGSIGVPIDVAEMKIIDPETGKTCPDGEPGEILIKGPNVMLGYWNRPEETAEAIQNGWFHSGDVGRRGEDGYFYIVDRIKDMIAIGGMKVFPSEVERVLRDSPLVADCAVVGFPHPVWGEEVIAFIVSPEGGELDSEAVRAYAIEHLGGYKVPSRYIAIEQLPRNPSGKILKTELRKWDSKDMEDADSTAPASPEDDPDSLISQLRRTHASARERLVTGHLQEQIRSLTGKGVVPPVDMALLETGMDSLMMVNLASHLQQQLGPGVDLPATLVFDYPRICDLATYLLQALDLDGATKKTESESSQNPAATTSETSPIAEMSEDEALQALMDELKE